MGQKLADREKQRVGINGQCSSLQKVNSRVPKDSTLEPVQFNGFINDLENRTNSEEAKFEDKVVHAGGNHFPCSYTGF